MQPSLKDGGSEATDSIGRLAQIVRLEEKSDNSVDVASCAISSDIEYLPNWGAGGRISGLLPSVDIRGDEDVEKWGRTTGFTKGKLTAIKVVVPDVAYPGGLFLTLCDQIEIEGVGSLFSQPGDSGALVVRSSDKAAVSQLNCGDEYGYSFASPLSTVLGTIGASLVL